NQRGAAPELRGDGAHCLLMIPPIPDAPFEAEDLALLTLLRRLDAEDYDFVPTTPETHARVLRRPAPPRPDLRDILGWSRTFRPQEAPADLAELLEAAGALERQGDVLKSAVRVARLQGRLLLHSAYPTQGRDAVFLGPDSYRFAAFLRRELTAQDAGLVVDMGGGCGAGALTVAAVLPDAEIVVTDVNPAALRLARINAAHA